MKQEKRRTTVYLTEAAHKWLEQEAKKQGISKNDVIQIMINREREKAK